MICAVFAASSDTCSIGSESSFLDRSAAGGALESAYRRNCDGATRRADRAGHCTWGFGLKAMFRDRDVRLSRGGMVGVVLRCRPHFTKMTRRQFDFTSGTCHTSYHYLYLPTCSDTAGCGLNVQQSEYKFIVAALSSTVHLKVGKLSNSHVVSLSTVGHNYCTQTTHRSERLI
jgi:hypothetical protein